MSELNEKIICVGSRKSELALIQTKHVISRLQKLYPKRKFEIHTMSTIGDRVLNVSLPKIGEKSLFTRDLEDALRNGGVDFVVHSLKDLPTALPDGMAIGAVLEREDYRDALVLNEKYKGHKIDTLPAGSIIGTSSLRRTAQIRRKYPHLEVCDIRGNLNTRLAKLDALTSKFSGIILAQAGLVRMGWQSRISQVLEPTDLLYAVGQGALAVECRSNDTEILEMLQTLMCLPTACQILAERSFLKTLGGGCSAPVAVCTKLNGSFENENCESRSINLIGAVWSLDGQTEINDQVECSLVVEKRKIENNDDDEGSGPTPKKRSKLSNSPNGQVRKSPPIVNDDQFPELLSNGAGDMDLQYLINVHGELFKKCPFYALHQHDLENGSSSTKKDECPLKIPVGQDFMGKCPYVDVDQKVDLAEKGTCPITGKQTANMTNNETDSINTADKSKSKICPYKMNKTENLHETKCESPKCPVFSKNETLEAKGHESCPFLQNQIKLIEYEDGDKPHPKLFFEELSKDCFDELFCGLFRHKCYSEDLFKKCDDLGRNLAENLIKQGALHVMKKAQDEIHSKA